jgi:hypothetical protein
MQKFDMVSDNRASELSGATFFVDLPTRGFPYPKGHPFHNKESIEVKMLTMKEEEILLNTSYSEKGIVVEKLLESIVLEKGFNPKEILESDQLAILLAARADAYGEDYQVIVTCLSCEKDYEQEVDLTTIMSNVKTPEIEMGEDGSYLIELPKSEKVVEYKILLPNEMQSIRKTVEKMKKMNIKTSENKEFFKRIILSVDGTTDREYISEFIDNLRILDSRFLSSKYAQTIPSLDLKFGSTCSHCNHEQEGGLPIQANFFFPEL